MPAAIAPVLRAAADGLSLSLTVGHSVLVGQNTVNCRLPDIVDVISESDIVFSICGFFNRVEMSAEKLQKSALVNHLLGYLKSHSAELGLNQVSQVYLDDNDILRFSVSSAYPLLHADQCPSPTATLIGLDLKFSWHSSISVDNDLFVHPFSPQFLLPIQTTLSTILGKFASRDLVRRYPLIFGPRRRHLDPENLFLPHICQSVLDIVARSNNAGFQRDCRRLTKRLQKRSATYFSDALIERDRCLSLPSTDDQESPSLASPGDEAGLLVSLQRLHRTFVRPTRFKGSSPSSQAQEITDQRSEFPLATSHNDEASPETHENLSFGHSDDEMEGLYFSDSSDGRSQPLTPHFPYLDPIPNRREKVKPETKYNWLLEDNMHESIWNEDAMMDLDYDVPPKERNSTSSPISKIDALDLSEDPETFPDLQESWWDEELLEFEED